MLGFVILRCPLAARRTFRNPPLKVYKEIPVSETPTVEVRAFAGLEQGSKEAEVPRQHDHVQVPQGHSAGCIELQYCSWYLSREQYIMSVLIGLTQLDLLGLV